MEVPRIIADKAGVVDYAYSRDGTRLTEEYRGKVCPYSDRMCDYSHCLSVHQYPEDAPLWECPPEDRAEFGYCARMVKDILDVELLLSNSELMKRI